MATKSVLLTAAILLSAAPQTWAATIGYTDVAGCFGLTTCVVAGGTVSSENGDLSGKDLNGVEGYGVGGGVVDAEIDSTEAILISFVGEAIIDSLEFVFLYEPPSYGDAEIPGGGNGESDETAAVEAFNGTTSLGIVYLNVTGDTTATATSGTVSNLSIANQSGGAKWLLSNPWGNTLITDLRFFSGDPGLTSAWSDFSLATTTFTPVPDDDVPVPEPTSLLLLGSGLATAYLRARRGRSKDQPRG